MAEQYGDILGDAKMRDILRVLFLTPAPGLSFKGLRTNVEMKSRPLQDILRKLGRSGLLRIQTSPVLDEHILSLTDEGKALSMKAKLDRTKENQT